MERITCNTCLHFEIELTLRKKTCFIQLVSLLIFIIVTSDEHQLLKPGVSKSAPFWGENFTSNAE